MRKRTRSTKNTSIQRNAAQSAPVPAHPETKTSPAPNKSGQTLKSSARIDEIRAKGREAQQAANAASTSGSFAAQRTTHTRATSHQQNVSTPTGAHAKPSKRKQQITTRKKSTSQKRTTQEIPVVHEPNKRTHKRSADTTRSASAIGQARMFGNIWTGATTSRGTARGFGAQKQQGAETRKRAQTKQLAAPSKRTHHKHTRSGLWKAMRVPLAIIVGIAVVIGAAAGIDHAVNGSKIYAGISIGNHDVSGMTIESATELLESSYSQRVAQNTAVFYISEEAQENAQENDTDENIEDQIGYEESLELRTQWTLPASEVEANLDIDKLVNEAYEVGREDGGLLTRLIVAITGRDIDVACTFNTETIETLCSEMTATVGEERVNYNIEMQDAVACVTEGHDGDEITTQWLTARLNETYLGESEQTEYLLETEHLGLQIDEEAAQTAANIVNASLASGATFTYKKSTWEASREDLAEWVTTEVTKTGTDEQGNTVWELTPLFDESAAKNSLLSEFSSSITGDSLEVTFETTGEANESAITVTTNTEGTVPLVADAISELNESFFVNESRTETPEITIETTDMPSSMSLEDAKAFGVVTEISTYTTQYSSGATARVNNIHTAADYITYSIAKANGGEWSFNETAGEATEERGYEDAGAIVSGEYSDAIGGGICQVATTVFNAVYDSGFPITERHNHSLRISSYPDGRDAAIAYGSYDLVWENDSTSDVLLVMSYTDSSVTATLWGVDPGYTVSTEYGEWEEGEEYSTTYETDDTLAEGTEYVETTGVNGSSITIVRTVCNADGETLHADTFASVYAAKNEVIVKGTASAS